MTTLALGGHRARRTGARGTDEARLGVGLTSPARIVEDGIRGDVVPARTHDRTGSGPGAGGRVRRYTRFLLRRR